MFLCKRDIERDLEEWLTVVEAAGDYRGVGCLKSPKILAIVEVVKKVPRGEKIVMFSYFKATVALIHYLVTEEMWIPSTMYHGSQYPAVNKRNLEQFNSDPELRVLVSTLSMGSHALDMQVANHVMIVDLWWNVKMMQQAIGRVTRIGQERNVHAHIMMAKKSIDMQMMALALGKDRVIENYTEKLEYVPQRRNDVNDVNKN